VPAEFSQSHSGATLIMEDQGIRCCLAPPKLGPEAYKSHTKLVQGTLIPPFLNDEFIAIKQSQRYSVLADTIFCSSRVLTVPEP
jgi:hypothetical protein